MTTKTAISHPYAPAHMTRSSFGNVPACCEAPEADHTPFVNGTTTTVVLKRDVRHLSGRVTPKGTVMPATRSNHESALQEIRPSKWFRNERGNLEEERGEYRMVATPSWTIRLDGDTHLTGIPWKWAREV